MEPHKEPSACSGCWTATGLHNPGHGLGVHMWWETRAVPSRSGPSAWVRQSCGSVFLFGLGPLLLQVGLGFGHSVFHVLNLGAPKELTEVVHAVTS